MNSCSVDALTLAMCSSVINFMCLDMVLIKCITLMIMMYPDSVIFFYLYKMVIGRGNIYPLMCGVFVLGYFLSGIPAPPPQMSLAPLMSSQFSGQFRI